MLAGTSQLVVLPAVVPLAGLPAGGELGAAAGGTRTVGTSRGGDSLIVRSYQHGDDLRRVHWRTSARRDELMVRIEECSERCGATVLLDHRIAAHRGTGPTSSLEYAVSLAASMYVHLRRHAPHVRLVTTDGVVRADGHPGQTALDALAALSATDQRELAGVPETTGTPELVAVFGALGAANIEALLRSNRCGTHNRAVLLDVAAWATAGDGQSAPHPGKAARLLVAAGWSVVVAGPEQSLSSVWEQLCISSHRMLGAPR
jgi:uncharacterized protein (DUF58 family)